MSLWRDISPNRWSKSFSTLWLTDLKYRRRFYQRQNALIDRYAEVMEMKELNLDEKTQQLQRRVKLLTMISLLINIVCSSTRSIFLRGNDFQVLFVIKMVASILSNSLAVISSVIDSTVDLVSSVILYWTTRAIRHRNQYRYPAGRTRLEPLAIIILSVIMCSASVQVLSESTKRLLGYVQYITHRTDRMPEVNMSLQQPVPIIVMFITIGELDSLPWSMTCLLSSFENRSLRVLPPCTRGDDQSSGTRPS